MNKGTEESRERNCRPMKKRDPTVINIKYVCSLVSIHIPTFVYKHTIAFLVIVHTNTRSELRST